MRRFYLEWPAQKIFQTPSEKSLSLSEVASRFPLPGSAYVRLLSVKSSEARTFYEKEALRSGWSVRQLDRQIASQFHERLALSKNKAAMRSALLPPSSSLLDCHRPQGWQIQLRRCGTDAPLPELRPRALAEGGRESPSRVDLCAEKGTAEAHYALSNLPNKVLAAEYQMVLPEEKLIAKELERSAIELDSAGQYARRLVRKALLFAPDQFAPLSQVIEKAADGLSHLICEVVLDM